VSSANTKGWLSDDACREGTSTGGSLALLKGLEKLKAGRERRLPSTEKLELTDGDRGIEFMKGGDMGELDNPSPEDNFRDSDRYSASSEWERLSSESSIGDEAEYKLEARFGNGDLGGARAWAS
jgi:hypothetical protein